MLRCHGGVKANGEFSLLFEEDAFSKPNRVNPALCGAIMKKVNFTEDCYPKNPEYRSLEFQKLSQAEIDIFGPKWIDQGAKMGKHWAYIPSSRRSCTSCL